MTVSVFVVPATASIVGAPGAVCAAARSVAPRRASATPSTTSGSHLTGHEFAPPVGAGDDHAFLGGQRVGELERSKAGSSVDEERVGREVQRPDAAFVDAVRGDEGVDPTLVPLLVEDEQDAAGESHDGAGRGAEDRERVLLAVPRRPLDNVLHAAGPDDDVLGGVVGGVLQDEIGLEVDAPGVLAVLPGVGHGPAR